MKFSDFIREDSLCVPLSSLEGHFAIHEMVWALDVHGHISRDASNDVIASVLKREELGNTGIGRGVAVPHAHHACVKRSVGTIGNHPTGIQFSSLDGEPVRLFFLLISPPDRPGDHLRALEFTSKALRQDDLMQRLKDAESPWEAIDLLKEFDAW